MSVEVGVVVYDGRPTATRTVKRSGSSDRDASLRTSHNAEASSTSVVTYLHQASDNAAGYIAGTGTDGLIDYGGGIFTLKVEQEFEAASYKNDYLAANASNYTESGTIGGSSQGSGGGNSRETKDGEWGSVTRKSAFAGGAVRVRYRPAGSTPAARTHSVAPGPVRIDLCPYTADRIIPGSVQFSWMGSVYRDFDGALYRDGTATTPGTLSGSIDYVSGVATLTDYTVGVGAFSLDMLWTMKGNWKTARMFFRTAGAPVRPGGFTLSVLDWSGTQLIATADANGKISGPHTEGFIEYQTGSVVCAFGDWVLESTLTDADRAEHWYDPLNITNEGKIWRPWSVDPATARYSAVVYTYLPLDKAILGMDPVRLPADGRVPFVRPGNVAVIHHTLSTDLGDGSAPVTLRPRLSYCHVRDALGVRLPEQRPGVGEAMIDVLAIDLDAGTVQVLDPTGYVAPFAAEHRIEDMRMVTDVDISGRVTVTPRLSHDFPAEGSYFSTALLYGDLQASVGVAWDQKAWTEVWSDAAVGEAASATYNQTAYPIGTTNAGAIAERWRVQFVTPNTVNVIGEYSGQVLTNVSIADPIAPENPNNGEPFFVIQPGGWGGGWATGNVLRFNTRAANRPLWVIRTVLASDTRTESDAVRIQIRGDAQ